MEKQLDNSDWSTLDDDILVKAFLKGDARAFQVLFKKYREMVSRLVFSILKEESHVEDVVQEVFILLHRNLSKFRGESALKTWIYRITVNEALRHLNRAKRWVALPDSEVDYSKVPSSIVMFDGGESPERVMIEGEKKVMIQQAINSLKPNHRIVLILYYLRDLDINEICEILEIPEGSVKSRLFYARDALKKAIMPFLGEIDLEMKGSHVL